MKIMRLMLTCSLLVTAVILTGCGDEESPTTTTTTEPESTLTTTAPAMGPAQDGDRVSVHYHGTLEDGTVFDTSRDGDPPLQFVLGAGGMIAGFENAVRGMAVGEIKTVTIPPEEAYGNSLEDLIIEVERGVFQDMELYEGQRLPMQNTQTGQSFWVTVVSFDEATVVIDANHELAGKTLTFEIELVAIDTAE